MHSKPIQPVCPICFTGHLERKLKQVTSNYRGNSITYEQPGEWCDHCDEGLLTGMDALVTQAKLLKWRAQIDHKRKGE